jgi:hypothetical protein
VCAFIIEDPMRVFVSDHFVVLHEVDAVGAQTTKRLVQLSSCLGLRSTVNLGHEKRFLPVPVSQRSTHSNLARAVVIVPAVVEEIDPAIDGLVKDAGAQAFIDVRQTQVPPAQTDRGYAFAGSAKDSIRHFFAG